MMILAGRQIYVVDDDGAVRDSLKILLTSQGATVDDFESGETFLAAYDPSTGGCLILDVHLAGMNGLDLLGRLRGAKIFIPVILISGNPGADMSSRALQLGAVDLLDKPVEFSQLMETILKVFEA